jgi:hypothetical protein
VEFKNGEPRVGPDFRLLARGTHARSAWARSPVGACGTGIRTQLDLECYCACRRHQRCHWTETQNSVRLRFLGCSRTSRCSSIPHHVGYRMQSTMTGREIKTEHLPAVRAARQSEREVAVGLENGSSSIETLRRAQRRRSRRCRRTGGYFNR